MRVAGYATQRGYPAASPTQESHTPQPASELDAYLASALATKLVGVLRGRHHHFLAKLHGHFPAAQLFLAHSTLEQSHADSLADRIVELTGQPVFSPQSLLSRGPVAYFGSGSQALEMANDELEAARASAGTLAEGVQLAGGKDLATRRLLMSVLDSDQKRVKELTTLVASLKARKAPPARASA